MIWLNNNRKYPKGFWTIKENVLEEAKKYSSKKEFEKKNISAFLAAYRYGFIKDMNWLVKQKQHKKNHWNETELKSESKKYSTRTEFSIKNRAAYNAAKKLSILDELFPKQEKKKLLRDTQKATGKTGKT